MGKMSYIPSVTHFLDAECEAFTAKEKKAYKKRLKMICPSKAIRQLAKEIADSDDPCGNCAYGNKCDTDVCRVPHTEAYMEALGIYPCYEGVLFYLCKELEYEQQEKQEEEQEKREELLDELDNALECAQSLIYDNLVTIRTLAEIIIGMSADNGMITPMSLKCVRLILDETQDILDGIDSGEYYETE